MFLLINNLTIHLTQTTTKKVGTLAIKNKKIYFKVVLIWDWKKDQKKDETMKEKYFNNKSLLALITDDLQIDYKGEHGLTHW